MASVALEAVTKVFPGGVTAVSGIDLQVRDHEFLVLLGPSGCGKSTTLRLIAGLEEVTSGEIRIGDRVVNKVAAKDRNIAMVFQNYALYPHMSVYRNMAFGLELRYGGGWFARGWTRLTDPKLAAELASERKGIRSRVQETARVLGIDQLLERMPRQLSGGERQRVALGRAMVRQPAVFLFDEPLSNLDAKLRLETRRELRQLHRRLNATMLYVTHDQTEALTLGQRIAVLNNGTIQQLGTPREVYDRPRNLFVAGFIGSPPMNFVSGSLARTDSNWLFEGVGLSVALPVEALPGHDGSDRTAAVLGVRPEDVTVQSEASPPDDLVSAATGEVAFVESVGDASYAHVEIAGTRDTVNNSDNAFVCKGPPRSELQAGAKVRLAIDPMRTHLFDEQNGENLAR